MSSWILKRSLIISLALKAAARSFLFNWENYFIVIGWEQANLSEFLICTAVQIKARAIIIIMSSRMKA